MWTHWSEAYDRKYVRLNTMGFFVRPRRRVDRRFLPTSSLLVRCMPLLLSNCKFRAPSEGGRTTTALRTAVRLVLTVKCALRAQSRGYPRVHRREIRLPSYFVPLGSRSPVNSFIYVYEVQSVFRGSISAFWAQFANESAGRVRSSAASYHVVHTWQRSGGGRGA